jgi:phospholipid transport system transporter-binding protein
VELNLAFATDKDNAPTSACLSIIGELDQTTLTKDYWPELSASDRQAICAIGRLNVNLAKVERTDTAGLAWLINIIKHAKQNKVKVGFEEIPDKLLNLADLSSAKTLLTH